MGIRISHLPLRSASLQEVVLAGNCIIIAEHNIISLERDGFLLETQENKREGICGSEF